SPGNAARSSRTMSASHSLSAAVTGDASSLSTGARPAAACSSARAPARSATRRQTSISFSQGMRRFSHHAVASTIRRYTSACPGPPAMVVGLSAVIVAVTDDEPRLLTVERSEHVPAGADADEPALPFGPLDPAGHRTLELGLRAWVREQAGLELGYVEQLYTF